jgi:pilus assembly protein Flp/PilA
MMAELVSRALRILAALKRTDGQDMVEYALVVTLIAFAATAGIKSLATKISSAYTSTGTTLNSYIS